jgi:Ni/Co efflux regulator RcnB
MIFLLSVLLSASAAAVPPPQSAQSTSAPASPDASPQRSQDESPDPSANLPVSLDRIKQSLSRPPAVRLEDNRFVFRVEVIGRKLTIEDILGPDYLKGPMPAVAGGFTHQEFLDLVTPKDVQGYAAFTNGEGLAVAATSFATSFALQALQKAIHKFQDAKQERDREAARKEVQDALAELEKARVKAGLPPK